MAGFTPEEPYYIARSEVKPPAALANMIFPWAGEAYRETLRKKGEDKDISAKCFLGLLLELRNILLQVC